MGRIAIVLSWSLNANSDNQPPEAKGDSGGGVVFSADHFQDSGFDSQPLPGDFFACVPGVGSGDEIVSGYHDTNSSNRKAGAGEARTYARDADGETVCEVWCKADGTIEITSVADGSKLNLNGVEIDQDGNISAPGTITTKAGTLGSIELGSHDHNTAMGPSGPPNP